jgi:hypothetical protein
VAPRALETAAAQPNVALKISGLGQPDKSWPVEGNRQIVREALAFRRGAVPVREQLPVDGLCIGYHALFEAFKDFVADRTPAEQRALFPRTTPRASTGFPLRGAPGWTRGTDLTDAPLPATMPEPMIHTSRVTVRTTRGSSPLASLSLS